MPGCLFKCPDITNTSLRAAWDSARDHYGPRSDAMNTAYADSLYATDLADFVEWVSDSNTSHGTTHDASDPVLFAKFINWRLSIGTTALGNLPQRIREYEGISCIPCPYDTASSSDRSMIWLGFLPASQVSHSIYRMKVTQRGNVWGFECTHDGCPYLVANGIRYFHA